MWSFDVNIHQGTFSTHNNVSDVRRYVVRIKKAGYGAGTIGIRPRIWSFDEAWVAHNISWDAFGKGHLSREELLAEILSSGKVFYSTENEAEQKMNEFVVSVQQVVREVYGQ